MNGTAWQSELEKLGLRSCLLWQRNQLLVEHYRDEMIPQQIAKINSCTKSVVATLIGIAVDRGLLPELSTPITAFFPELAHDPDPHKQTISLEHLLTMSAGWSWTEFGGPQSFRRMTESNNWVQFTLEQPLSHVPGQQMVYNSGISQLLSALLVQVTGQSTASFAEQYLFQPLGISSYEWDCDPTGIHTGGFGLKLLPNDMLKLGLLYLQQGIWNGHKLLSNQWIKRSTQPSIVAESGRGGYYGYHWWIDCYELANKQLHYYYALGFGGQYIIVVPQLDTVVVLTNDKLKRRKIPVHPFRQFIAAALIEQL